MAFLSHFIIQIQKELSSKYTSSDVSKSSFFRPGFIHLNYDNWCDSRNSTLVQVVINFISDFSTACKAVNVLPFWQSIGEALAGRISEEACLPPAQHEKMLSSFHCLEWYYAEWVTEIQNKRISETSSLVSMTQTLGSKELIMIKRYSQPQHNFISVQTNNF